MLASILHLPRRIFLSVLVIAAAAAMVGVGSFAAFSDTDAATGTLMFGDVVIVLDDTDWNSNFGGINCNEDNMGSADVCTVSYVVTYSGSLDVNVDLVLTKDESPAPLDCFSVTGTWDHVGDAQSGALNEAGHFAATGETFIGIITVAVGTHSPQNDCQNEDVQVTLTVTATEA